ncbi:ATP-binding protein [Microbacterium telephonicum]|uniref:AAA ATPase-like protein n=1 Tax=Microbacterium telephonicum TaxID=1714841 RepID=A0A498BQL1_9MICO|nr:ATP-binding protein [Microbacterium telephonicum]RLK46433.1 AAA ATPase-like protein [Microbacterium telephonicum]
MKWLSRLFSKRNGIQAPEPSLEGSGEVVDSSTELLATTTKLPRKYDLAEVFTPGQPADKGFVKRPTQERDLLNTLDERGTQILVWGESGAGKSSLVRNVLKQTDQPFVTTRCEQSTTYEQILASAFDTIKAGAWTKTTNSDTRTVGGGTKLGGGALVPAEVHVDAEWEASKQDDWEAVVAAQVTSEALAVRLGEKGLVWVIEDAHKVTADVRVQISDAMKVFSDASPDYPKLRIIVLGVSDTAGQILRAPSNMGGRLADIPIPPLTDKQLKAILSQGGALLNVDFTQVMEPITRHSVGIASITHALASACCQALDVRSTVETTVMVTPAALTEAKAAYVRTRGGDMKDKFDIALEQPTTRRYHNYAIILRALAQLPISGATHAAILAQIKKDHPLYPPGNLTTYLRKLQTPERSALVRKTSTGTFRYDRPLYHSYALLRFDLDASAEDEFWANGLVVSDTDKEVSVRLAEEVHPEAPEDPEEDLES